MPLTAADHRLVAVEHRCDQPLPALLQHSRDVPGALVRCRLPARHRRVVAQGPPRRRSAVCLLHSAALHEQRDRCSRCTKASVSVSRAKGDNEFPTSGRLMVMRWIPSSPTATTIPDSSSAICQSPVLTAFPLFGYLNFHSSARCGPRRGGTDGRNRARSPTRGWPDCAPPSASRSRILSLRTTSAPMKTHSGT